MDLFDKVSLECSKITTQRYSTSFSLGIRLLSRRFQSPIYAVYGFVRFADEIVDTFHQHNKKELLDQFRSDTHKAISEGLSLNPILNSFQWAVNTYKIDLDLIDTFLQSMEMDLSDQQYDRSTYEKYILGSAEVVGLMCLRIFTEGNDEKYQLLKPLAMKLGSAFQKINFLRDLNADVFSLGRAYFPGFEITQFDALTKAEIEADIESDFQAGLQGIRQLPKSARFGVYLAYVYYYTLFAKIKNKQPAEILKERVRIPDAKKYSLIFSSYFKHRLNLI